MKKQKKPKETCGLFKEYITTLEERMTDETSYIHEHLGFLYFLTRQVKPMKILEIGTGRGDSTLAFATACLDNEKGCVITIDVDPCKEAREMISLNGLDTIVTFVQADSLKAPIDGMYDIVFIDGLHTKSQVFQELEKYSKRLADGGWIILHDTNNPAHPDVQNVVLDFIVDSDGRYEVYEFYHCNGLTVLHLKED